MDLTRDFQEDRFWSLYRESFQGPLPVGELRRLEGPVVYVFLAPLPVRYPKGESRVVYIGYTESTTGRFKDHEKIRAAESFFAMPLRGYLRDVKEHCPGWRRLSESEKRSTHVTMERVFLYIFNLVMGAIPDRNNRRDLPGPQVMVVANWSLDQRLKEYRKEILLRESLQPDQLREMFGIGESDERADRGEPSRKLAERKPRAASSRENAGWSQSALFDEAPSASKTLEALVALIQQSFPGFKQGKNYEGRIMFSNPAGSGPPIDVVKLWPSRGAIIVRVRACGNSSGRVRLKHRPWGGSYRVPIGENVAAAFREIKREITSEWK